MRRLHIPGLYLRGSNAQIKTKLFRNKTPVLPGVTVSLWFQCPRSKNKKAPLLSRALFAGMESFCDFKSWIVSKGRDGS